MFVATAVDKIFNLKFSAFIWGEGGRIEILLSYS